MGKFSKQGITDKGRQLLAMVQDGAIFDATKLVVGSGTMATNATVEAMTAVIAPVKELEITKKKYTNDGKMIFGGVLSNSGITTEFYFREFALYARPKYVDGFGNVTYGNEVLYAYGNAGSSADLIPAYSTSTAIEKVLDMIVYVGNDTTVNLEIDSGVSVSRAEVEPILTGKYGGNTNADLDSLVESGNYSWIAPAGNVFGASVGALFNIVVECADYNGSSVIVQTATHAHAAGGTLPLGASFRRTYSNTSGWGVWTKAYNTTVKSLSALGLTNADMSDSNLSANMAKLFAAMHEGSTLIVSGTSGTDNLATSIAKKLETDVGIPYSSYTITVEFTVKSDKLYAAELTASITHTMPYVCDTYSCQYYNNATLTKFHRNQATEYYWNMKPETVGYNTLLEYMAARYSEHPVVFATVSGFSDLPSGVESGQAVINICGGVLTVTLFTRTAVWYRGTNSLTAWTNEWRKGYDSNNMPSPADLGALPLDGTKAMTGAAFFLNNGLGRVYCDRGVVGIDALESAMVTDKAGRQFLLANANKDALVAALVLREWTNGSYTDYKVYGEHNPKAGALHQDPGTSLLRNSKIASSETNPSVNGEICWTYK